MANSWGDLVRTNPAGRERGLGQGWTRGRVGIFRGRPVGVTRGGPLRPIVRPSPYKIAKSFSRTRDTIWQHDLFNDSMIAAGLTRNETGTKLYISNLDYGVSNEDIKELFSDVGELMHSAVHYDRSGRPTGSAEVIYMRRSDALAALKRYNNVQLDGKAMKIEIIGDKIGLPVSAHVNIVEGANGRGRRTVYMMSNRGGFQRGRASGNIQAARGRGRNQAAVSHGSYQALRGRGRGRGLGWGRGRGRERIQRSTNKSAEDLDKELENYHAEAMNTS